MTQQKTPGLGQAALQVGDVHVRNRGTIVEFWYTLIQGLITRELSALEATNDAQESAVERTIDPFVFYRALGNRSWRK